MSVDDRYLNARRGPTVPPGSHAESVPVIARFVMLDGSEEWKPAVRVRLVRGLVLVRVGATTYQQEYTWLADEDVTTAIRPRQGLTAPSGAGSDLTPEPRQVGELSLSPSWVRE